MEIFFKRVLKNKNKGFSLVEVLCAVVLLALVATPILQALYSGMVVNNKSRKMLAAADLASDTMEFVSSLSFNDFKYKNSVGTEIKVPGLKSYYWGNDVDTSDSDTTNDSVQFNSFKLRSAELLYPNGPHAELNEISYTNVSGWTNITNNRSVKFSNVMMDGYKFNVKIITEVPKNKVVENLSGGGLMYSSFVQSDLDSEKYYCYDVTVEVIDPATNIVLATASTTVPNNF